LDAILYTHEHSDHLLGLDELRRFCLLHDKRLPVYTSRRVIGYIERMFPYALVNPPPYKGLPELDLHEIQGEFKLGSLTVKSYVMPHGSTQSLGFRFSDQQGSRFAYLTDCKEVSEEIRKDIAGIPLLILDALRKKPHPTHLSLDEAVEVTRAVKPDRALFTHIYHELEHHQTNQELPKHIALAYDGQVIEI
jgi:phosphoribosyl 1,2-cyclic phosphate phosphodiesterase